MLKVLKNILFFLILILLVSCHPYSLERPYGTIRLADISELKDITEKFFPEIGILLRQDGDGFYAMSTFCTYDLSQLVIKNEGQERVLVSKYTYNESKYSLTGKVLHGPAKVNLPYFELFLSEGKIDGPKNTMYVEIGREVSQNKRFKFNIQ